MAELAIPYIGQATFLVDKQAGSELDLRAEEKDYSENEILLASSGMAVSELIFSRMFGEVKRLNTGKRILSSIGKDELKTIISKTTKDKFASGTKALFDISKETAKDALEEGFLDEFATNITQNAIQKYGLGNEEVGLLDNSLDAIAGGISVGGALSGSPRALGLVTNYISDKNRRNKVYNNTKEIAELRFNLDQSELDDNTKTLLNNRVKTLLNENAQIINSTIESFDNLNDKDRVELLDISKEANSLELSLDKINNTQSSDKKIVDTFEDRIQEIHKRKAEILSKPYATVPEDVKEFAEKIGETEDVSKYVNGSIKINVGDSSILLMNKGDNLLIDSISTKKDKRGSGSASNALDKVTELADQENKTVELIISPQDTDTSIEGLVKLYESKGFNPVKEGDVKDGDRFIRTPKSPFDNIDKVINEDVATDASFNSAESEGESLSRLEKEVSKGKTAEQVAKEHTESYLEYLNQQNAPKEVLDSKFVKSFEKGVENALKSNKEFDPNQSRSFENGSRIDENSNSITEAEFLTKQGNITSPKTKTPKTEFETNLNTYTVNLENSNLKITPKLGKAKPSTAEVKKVTEQYIQNTNFDTGQKALTGEGINESEIIERVISDSKNPKEIATTLTSNNFESEDLSGTVDFSIATVLRDGGVNKESLKRTVGNQTEGVSNSYYRKVNGETSSLDAIREKAQQLTESEISIEDVAQFIINNNSPKNFLEANNNQSKKQLEDKFQELTGLNPTTENINKVAGVTERNNTIPIDTSNDNDVPFQTESSQKRIKRPELTNLVDRLKKTGLANDVKIWTTKTINKFLEDLGVDTNLKDDVKYQKELSDKGVTPIVNNINTINNKGSFLTLKESEELQKEIERNYSDNSLDMFKKDDIRMKIFNYDNPIARKTINNVDLRIAEGLIRDKRKSYLLYANGKIIGEFKSVDYIKNIIIEIESRLIEEETTVQKLIVNFQKATDNVNGFVYNGVVYLNIDTVKKDTPIHEYGHLWNSYIKENNPEVFKKGLSLIKGSEYHKQVLANEAYKHLDTEGKLEEALAQAIGEKGVKILNESLKAKFNAWFKNLFTQIARGLNLRNITPTKLANITLDKFTDLAAAELLSGKEIVENKNKIKENSTIDNVIEREEAIIEAKRKLTEKFNNKKFIAVDVKKALVKYIRDNIDSKQVGELQKSELNKLLGLVKKANTKRALLKAFEEVNKVTTNLDNKLLKRKIDKILGSRFSKKESGRRKANITDEQAEKILSSINKNTNVAKKNIDDQLLSLIDSRDALESKETLTESESLNLEALSISIDLLTTLNSTDVNVVNSLLTSSFESINSIFQEGRSDLKALREARKIEDAEFLKNILEDVNPENKTTLKTSEELNVENKQLQNILKRSMFNILSGKLIGSLDSVATIISKKGGANRDSSKFVQFVNLLKKRETLKKTRISSFSKTVIDSQKEIFGSVRKADKVLNKNHTITLERYEDLKLKGEKGSVNVNFTTSQLLNVWMNYRNPKLRPGLENNGFTGDVVSKINEILSEDVINYGESLFNIYEEMHVASNEVYKNMNFHSLAKEDFYAGKVYRSSISLKEDTDALLGGVTNINTTGYGSQKERVNNDRPIEAVDVNFLIKKAIQESSHYVAYAEAHRQYNKLLKNEDFQKAIQLNNKGNGDLIIKMLNYYKVRDLEQGGDKGLAILDYFGRNIAKSTLALKTKIGLTQTISFLNGGFDMPLSLNPVKFVSYYNPVDIIKTGRELLKESDYIKNRYGVGGIDQAMLGLSDLASQSEITFSGSDINAKRKAVSRFYKKALDIAMLNVKAGDSVGIMGAIPAYNAWYDRYLSKGNSPKEAKRKALIKFEASVDRSQQTTSAFGKSQFQKHPVARYFTMFATAPIQNQQNAMFHFRELMRGIKKGQSKAKGNNFRNTMAFLNYQFAQPILYTYIAQVMAGSLSTALGFGDEEPDDTDKDLLRSVIMGNSNSIPIIGGVSQALIETVVLDKEFTFGSLISSPLLDNTSKLQEDWMKAFNSKTAKTRAKYTEKALKNTSGLLLAFPNILSETLLDDDIYFNDEIDTEVKFLKGLGYSDYVIEKARTKRISREKSKKEKEKVRKRYDESVKKYKKEIENKKTNPIFKKQEDNEKR